MAKEVIRSEKTLYRGQILTLSQATVLLQDGTTATREIVRTTGAAAILALNGDKALFVRQWRTPLNRETLELVAGKIEPKETPLAAAKRELNEEAGLEAGTWRPLTSFFQSAGFSDAKTTLFLATGLTPALHKRAMDPGEFVQVQWLTLAQAQAAHQDGRLCDAKSTLGLALWELEQKAGNAHG
ncbi:NUDIX hydrolase [Lacticaseibacillus yichunensis]|uniref:NUDIX hydrolase n=1 Tax=Lacticaseibacillus yichunensis TaxID=2486015 RepID=A0ABW4CP48_9LACO|nr:NUDIX hydrolase [Lacticaseibacillus yichunensis]